MYGKGNGEMDIRLRLFCALLTCCFIHNSLCMQENQPTSFVTRMKNHFYSSCLRSSYAFKRLALSALKWAWQKKYDLGWIVATQASADYFESDDQENTSNFSDHFWQALRFGADRLSDLENAMYIRYKDEHGVERRCYSTKNHELFQTLFIGGSDLVDEEPQVLWDKRIMLRDACLKIGSDLFAQSVAQIISFKLDISSKTCPSFLKRIALRTRNVLFQEGLQRAVLSPFMHFGAKARQIGIARAFRSLLHAEK